MKSWKSKERNKPGVIIIEGHVQGLSNLRTLGQAGIPTYVVDKSICLAQFSRYCGKFFKCPDFESDEFAYFLIEIAKKESLTGWMLLPSNDHAVLNISRHKSMLSEYYNIVGYEINVILNIYDKVKLIEFAKESEIPVPLTWSFNSIDEISKASIEYPVIVKGRFGLTFFKLFGKKAFTANNKKELNEIFKMITLKSDAREVFTQQLIEYSGIKCPVSFTALCLDGEPKTYWMGQKLREHPFKFGTATLAQSVYIEDCHRYAIKLLKGLNYSGVCEIEFLYNDKTNRYELIEMNPRTWLWVGLAKYCGVNFPLLLYDIVNKHQVEFPQSYSLDIKWVNWITDSVTSAKALLLRKMNLKDYFLSLRGRKVKAILSLRDILPGLIVIPLSIYLAKKRNII